MDADHARAQMKICEHDYLLLIGVHAINGEHVGLVHGWQ